MREQMERNRVFILRVWHCLIMGLLPALLVVSCGESDTKAPERSPFKMAEKRVVDTTTPPWVAPSAAWGDTLRWTLDSTGAIMVDGLSFRLQCVARKVFLGGPKADEHPLWFSAEMTLRPIPRWPLAEGFEMDSATFYDPVRSVWLKSLPMLSGYRAYRNATVRTQFASDASKRYTYDLDEGQPLEATVFFHWDHRTVIVTPPPVPVSFLTEIERSGQPQLPNWQRE